MKEFNYDDVSKATDAELTQNRTDVMDLVNALSPNDMKEALLTFGQYYVAGEALGEEPKEISQQQQTLLLAFMRLQEATLSRYQLNTEGEAQ